LLERLIRNLEERSWLSGTEKAALQALPWTKVAFGGDEEIARYSDRPNRSQLLVTGLTARVRYAPSGDRQILALHVPGDFVDLQSFLLKEMDHSVVSMSRGELAAVPHDALRILCNDHPRLARLLWRATLVDAAIHREWILGLGRLSAAERLAHLLCELCYRLGKVGLASEHKFELPLSQADWSDVLGLSNVHVNRVLQDMRRRQLISLRGKHVAILNWPELSDLAGFDPQYLHFDKADIL
jgi:CRP-like cAMP-binding protein